MLFKFSNFSSLSVLNMKASPKLDKILAVSSILSPPFDNAVHGLSVKVRPESWEIAKKRTSEFLNLIFQTFVSIIFLLKVPLSWQDC